MGGRSKPRSRATTFDELEDMQLNHAFRIVNLDLRLGPSMKQNLDLFYSLCAESEGLHVTTSCFTAWKQNQRLNGHAKLIPAVRVGGAGEAKAMCPIRIFFFDDNVEFDGREDSPGICNLRDVETGEFVQFGRGVNGFRSAYVGKHTVVHHSPEYRNVIVKANILDALGDSNYFFSIVQQYAQPGEKIIVFMDVNSTIMCNDTSAEKDIGSTLLSAMFELMEIRPTGPFTFKWRSSEPTRLERTRSLKQIAKDVTKYDHQAYSSFWTSENCKEFLAALAEQAPVWWSSRAGPVDPETFEHQFRTYLGKVSADLIKDGIASSWFEFFSTMQRHGHHTVILNSFGVDTRKVVLATVPDESQVMQVTANYELWSEQDVRKFEVQYRSKDSPGPIISSGRDPQRPSPPPAPEEKPWPSINTVLCCSGAQNHFA